MEAVLLLNPKRDLAETWQKDTSLDLTSLDFFLHNRAVVGDKKTCCSENTYVKYN